MTAVTITKRQGEVLQLMRNALVNTGAVPTAKMLMGELGVSRCVAYNYVSDLIDYGLIHRRKNNHLELCDSDIEVIVKSRKPGIRKGYKYKERCCDYR